MEKTILESKIKDSAKNKLVSEYKEMIQMARRHPILKELSFGEMRIFNALDENIVFWSKENQEKSSKGTNIADVLENRLKELEKQELDEILSKLDSVKYLFQ